MMLRGYELYTQSEYARLVGKERSTICNMVRKGELNTLKIHGAVLIVLKEIDKDNYKEYDTESVIKEFKKFKGVENSGTITIHLSNGMEFNLSDPNEIRNKVKKGVKIIDIFMCPF